MTSTTKLYSPLVKKFSSDSGNKYLYDCYSNNIFNLDSLKNSKLAVSPISPVFKIQIPFSKEELTEGLKNNLSHLILNVTEQCNLRCDYCTYSGSHVDRREHAAKFMTPKTGKAAIDWFHKHSSLSEKITISFYGGEPLLSFPLIKELVSYAKKLFADKKLRFQITTNGTMLHKEVIEWLPDNNIVANITINGDKLLHDRFRHYSSGKGSYNEIMKNLQLWKELHPESFNKQAFFTINYLNISDLLKIRDWLNTDSIFKNKVPLAFRRISLRSASGELKKKFENYIKQDEAALLQQLKTEYIENLEAGNIKNNIWGVLWDSTLSFIHHFEKANLQMKYPYTGGCAPLLKRTFIGVNGEIKLCEKSDGKTDFGNIYDGINYELLTSLITEFEVILNIRCHSCWALRRCYLCINDILKGNKADKALMFSRCKNIRFSFTKELELYSTVKEKGTHLLNHLHPPVDFMERIC